MINPSAHAASPSTCDEFWWRGAVLYQIYPRSFQDANGDGIGDLPGVLSQIDYLAALGIDGFWLGPVFTSPMADFGYDVADYRSIDPLFGTLDDFERLLTRAHQLGLKVVIDLVLNHTSDRHPWFIESRSDRTNAKADWYVWADAKWDGTAPNNWLSVFGGPAWQWEPRREQYYLHNFLAAQPDLNLHHPAVQHAILDEIEVWLKRGVDGCRLDVANYYMQDPQLRDNPPRPKGEQTADGVPEISPYGRQWHIYDKSRPENLHFIKTIRHLFDRYPGTMTVAEIHDDHSTLRAAEYTAGSDRLHTAYSFGLLGPHFGTELIRNHLNDFAAQPGNGWPAWAFSNHDVPRAVSRWGQSSETSSENKTDSSPAFAKLLIALLCSLRGTIFLYQGEELGLPEADIPIDRLQDPFGRALWPVFKGRDGCRTPMPWDSRLPHAGFSVESPWLPIPENHKRLSVADQQADPNSVLTFTRRFLHWRKTEPALRFGKLAFIDAPAPILAFTRSLGDTQRLCVFNLGPTPATMPAPPGFTPLDGPGLSGCGQHDRLLLKGYESIIGTLPFDPKSPLDLEGTAPIRQGMGATSRAIEQASLINSA